MTHYTTKLMMMIIREGNQSQARTLTLKSICSNQQSTIKACQQDGNRAKIGSVFI